MKLPLMITIKVGCFLSHYLIWQDALKRGFKRIMIMEDDAAPEMGYIENLATYMEELNHVPEWDFLYIARYQVYTEHVEPIVEKTQHWVWPQFNTWALNYVINESGKNQIQKFGVKNMGFFWL